MKTKTVLILCISILIFGCKSSETKIQNLDKENNNEVINTKTTVNRKDDNAANIEQIRGLAYDRKGGAIVECNSVHYWIQGKDYWEDKYLNKTVIVRGTIIKRNDNPVFLDTGEIKVQGIPVKTEEELQTMNSRFWIINAEISLADK